MCLRATVGLMLFSVNTTCTSTHTGSIQKEVWKSCGVTGGHCHLGGGYCPWLMFPCKQKPFMSPRLSFQLLSWKCALNLLDLPQGSSVCVCVCVCVWGRVRAVGDFIEAAEYLPAGKQAKTFTTVVFIFFCFSYPHWEFTQSFIHWVFHCSWVLITC